MIARWLYRAMIALASIYLALAVALLAFIELYPVPRDLPRDAAIVALGGGQRADGTMARSTAERLWTAVDVFARAGGRLFVVSGGKTSHETRPMSASMVTAARTAGIPADRLVTEPRARSTLQNALFSAQAAGLGPDTPVIVVTHRYHLPRAWASFRWAGMKNLTLYPVDDPATHWLRFGIGPIFLEATKIILNGGRAGLASAAALLGVPQDRYIRLLD